MIKSVIALIPILVAIASTANHTATTTTTKSPPTTTAAEPLVLNGGISPEQLASLIASADSGQESAPAASVVAVDEGDVWKRSPSSSYGSYSGGGGGGYPSSGYASGGYASGGYYSPPPAYGSTYGNAGAAKSMGYGVGYSTGQQAASGFDLGKVIKLVSSGAKNVMGLLGGLGQGAATSSSYGKGYGGGQGYVSYEPTSKGIDFKALGLGVVLGAAKGLVIGTKVGLIKGMIINRLKQALLNKFAAKASPEYTQSYASGACCGGGSSYGSSYDNNYRSDTIDYNSNPKGDTGAAALPLTYGRGRYQDGSYDGSYYVKPSSTGYGDFAVGAAVGAANGAKEGIVKGLLYGDVYGEGQRVYGVTKRPVFGEHYIDLNGRPYDDKYTGSNVTKTNNRSNGHRRFALFKSRKDTAVMVPPPSSGHGQGCQCPSAYGGEGSASYANGGGYSVECCYDVTNYYRLTKPKLAKKGKGYGAGILLGALGGIPNGLFAGWYLARSSKEILQKAHIQTFFDPPPQQIIPPYLKHIKTVVH